MPIYTYENYKGHRIEKLIQDVNNRPEDIEHNGEWYTLVPSVPSDPKFKGTGFYTTDYNKG